MNRETETLKSAFAYLRVASRDEADHNAVDSQREVCRQLADKHGLKVVAEYVDLGRPGRLEQQVELQRLLESLAQRTDVTAVVVYDLARLARDLPQLEFVLEQVRACGAELLTVTGVEVAERFVQSQRMREAFRRLPKLDGDVR